MTTAKCIAFANYKGGTGKTTSCLSIAGSLAKKDNKVLLIDLDPQASATSGLGIDTSSLDKSIYDALLTRCPGYTGTAMTRVILETKVGNIDLAPSEPDLVVAEMVMQGLQGDKVNLLDRILEDVRPYYDFILIDLPPSAGLLTINGLMSADLIIIPLDVGVFVLDSVDNLLSSLEEIKRASRHSLNSPWAVITRYREPNVLQDMFGRSTPRALEVESRVRKAFKTVFLAPEGKEVYESQKQCLPLSHYAPASRVARAYKTVADAITGNSDKK